MTRYFVVGGEYADTTFTQIADGHEEQTFGPFSEQEAHDFWRGITGRTVDNAMVRYRIRPDEALAGPAYYVVGGEYADTTFTRIAPGKELQVFGPYTRPDALSHWRAITGKSVDCAMTRYDIASEEELKELRG
jgi:hypothetical protein